VYDDGSSVTVQLGARIGEGVFGSVYNGLMYDADAKMRQRVAVKIQQCDDEAKMEVLQYQRLWADEEAATANCICRWFGAQVLSVGPLSFMVVVMEKYAGTLQSMQAQMTDAHVFRVILDITRALEYLHRTFECKGRLKFSVHRDVHENNILMTSKFEACLGDMGWCGVYFEMPAGSVCTVDRTVPSGSPIACSLSEMRRYHRQFYGSRRSDLLMLIGASLRCFKQVRTGDLHRRLFAIRVEKYLFDPCKKPRGWFASRLHMHKPCDATLVAILEYLFEQCDSLSGGVDMYARVRDLVVGRC